MTQILVADEQSEFTFGVIASFSDGLVAYSTKICVLMLTWNLDQLTKLRKCN